MPTERRLTYSVCYARTLWEVASERVEAAGGEGIVKRGEERKRASGIGVCRTSFLSFYFPEYMSQDLLKG